MFAKIKNWLFPISKDERTFVFLLALLHVCVTVNFWIVHNLKDISILTAPGSGAECINYLKIIVFFMTLCFVATYSWAARKVRQRSIIRFILTSLSIIWLLFFAVLIPYSSELQASSAWVSKWQAHIPAFRWVFPVAGYWIFSFFFLVAELWAMIGYSLLFWQFVNTKFSIDQSKRYYPIFLIVNGMTTIIAGAFFSVCADSLKTTKLPGEDFDKYLFFMRYGCLFIAGICWFMIWTYNQLYKAEKGVRCAQEESFLENVEEKVGFFSSLKRVIGSWYLGLVFVLGLCYNFAHTMIDITWKQQVKQYCKTSLEVQGFFGDFTMQMGIGIMICGLISTAVVRKLGWLVSAMLTPVIICISGNIFLGSVVTREWDLGYFSTLAFAVFFGRWHEFIVRSVKHSFFNITRELVYVPLDYQMQVKGKAIADVLGGRIGKMCGALLQGILLLFMTGSTQEDLIPYTATFFWCTLLVWIVAIFALNKRFTALIRHQKM